VRIVATIPARASRRIMGASGSFPLSRAGFADPVEDDLVVGDLEPRRGQFFQSLHALVEVEDITALLTMEVMVVPLVSALVAGRLTWDLDTADLPFFLKVLERAVDGGDPERGDALEGDPVDLIRKKRMIVIFQDRADRFLLSGGSAFDGQDPYMITPAGYFKPSTMVVTLCLIIES